MFNKKFYFILITLTITSCVQDGANVIYKENNSTYANNSTKQHDFQPSYMRGTYVKTANNGVVRDLRKVEENNYNQNLKDNDVEDIEEDAEEKEIEVVESKTETKKTKTIRVKEGDSLYGLAREYNMKLSEIVDLNNISKPYNIYIGQRIKVYDNETVKQQPKTEYKTVKIQQGDNLLRIALNNNSTLREIATINNIKPPYKVYVGQKIKVPVKNSGEVKSLTNKKETNKEYYKVQKGDNLYSISRDTGIPVGNLISYNNLKKPYNIYVGQKLYLKNRNNNTSKTSQKQPQQETKQVVKLEKVEQPKTQPSSTTTSSQPTQQSNALFSWPVRGDIIKKFGKQANGDYSDAIHIKAPLNTPILAAGDGEIAYAGNELKGYGNIIIVKHNNGWLSIYGYCDTMKVKVKDKVSKGQTIGTVGQTGDISEPQLYFSIRKGRVVMDPMKYLSN